MKIKNYKAVMAKLDDLGNVVNTKNFWYTQNRVDILRRNNNCYAGCSDEQIVEHKAKIDGDYTHCLKVDTVFEDIKDEDDLLADF